MPLFHTPLFNPRFLAQRVVELTADSSRSERKIDRRVYALFGLTDEEIRLVEGQGSGRPA